MASAKPNIVLVEDDLNTQKATQRLLQSYGYDVEIFASAERFLDRAGNKPIDCLLLDINLGIGCMDGIELQRRLLETGCVFPTIIITGRDDEKTIGKAIDQGCIAYLHKPFEPLSLKRALEQAITRI